jgi:hypothetical protein
MHRLVIHQQRQSRGCPILLSHRNCHYHNCINLCKSLYQLGFTHRVQALALRHLHYSLPTSSNLLCLLQGQKPQTSMSWSRNIIACALSPGYRGRLICASFPSFRLHHLSHPCLYFTFAIISPSPLFHLHRRFTAIFLRPSLNTILLLFCSVPPPPTYHLPTVSTFPELMFDRLLTV